jgi:hypothetical protein
MTYASHLHFNARRACHIIIPNRVHARGVLPRL